MYFPFRRDHRDYGFCVCVAEPSSTKTGLLRQLGVFLLPIMYTLNFKGAGRVREAKHYACTVHVHGHAGLHTGIIHVHHVHVRQRDYT